MSEEIVEACFKDLTSANLRCQQEFIRRYLAALLTKRFVIFTGLAGSGKTKIAQAFARWISPTCAASDPFTPGSAIPASRISYGVLDADRLAVELWNDPDPQRATKVVLPRALIQEWVDYITKNHIDEGTPAHNSRGCQRNNKIFHAAQLLRDAPQGGSLRDDSSSLYHARGSLLRGHIGWRRLDE